MLPGGLEAIGAGVVLAAVTALVTAVPPFRRSAPEVLLATSLVVALALVESPLSEGGNAMWRAALGRSTAVPLVLLALVPSRVGKGLPDPGPVEALVAGFLLGWLPATALIAPRAAGPRDAARLTLMATAASVASPLGGAVQVLLVPDPLRWLTYAALPALAAALVAAPGRDRLRRPALPPVLLLGGGTGILVALLHSELAGLTAAALVLLLLNRPPSERPPGLERAWPLRMALAAIGVGAAAQLVGLPWFLGQGAEQAHAFAPDATLLTAGTLAGAGLLLDPTILATLLERTASELPVGEPHAMGLLLPLAMAPMAPLALAAASHGWRVLAHGLPVALLQLAILLAWAVGTA